MIRVQNPYRTTETLFLSICANILPSHLFPIYLLADNNKNRPDFIDVDVWHLLRKKRTVHLLLVNFLSAASVQNKHEHYADVNDLDDKLNAGILLFYIIKHDVLIVI